MYPDYKFSRLVLRIVQILGWLATFAGIAIGVWAIKQGDRSGGALIVIGAVFAGGINHALMAIGLAIFDLLDRTGEVVTGQFEVIKAVRKIGQKPE